MDVLVLENPGNVIEDKSGVPVVAINSQRRHKQQRRQPPRPKLRFLRFHRKLTHSEFSVNRNGARVAWRRENSVATLPAGLRILTPAHKGRVFGERYSDEILQRGSYRRRRHGSRGRSGSDQGARRRVEEI